MTEKHLSQEQVLENAHYHEYSSSADPIGAGFIKPVPYHVFPHTLHEEGKTRIISLDLSKQLGCSYPATSPALLANFIHIKPEEKIETDANASSHLFYVIRGTGRTEVDDLIIPWSVGDFFVLPANSKAMHYAESDSAFYYINDEPLLNYLGAEATEKRFKPTLFTEECCFAELEKAIHSFKKHPDRNRVSILLSNKMFPQTRTITHVLWAMFGILEPGQVQPPHRHQSVAIDFAVECQPGCYTLIGEKLDENGHIIDPVRADWKPYSVFVTPPGYWHSHHNESGVAAHVIPLQDAGLHTYLRTLDIQFAHPKNEPINLIG